MKMLIKLVMAAALIAFGVWFWSVLFPSPERIIRKRLAEVARAVSFVPNEGTVAKLMNVERLASRFSPDVEVRIDVLGGGHFTLNGRDEITQAAMAARSQLNSLAVTFLDVNVALGLDKQSAVVDLTAKATVPGRKEFEVQEMKFTLKKIDGAWLITRVESVKTLSRAGHNQANSSAPARYNSSSACDAKARAAGSVESRGPATLSNLILCRRTNVTSLGAAASPSLTCAKCSQGFAYLTAKSRVNADPPVNSGAIVNITVPSESRTFHSVRCG